MVTGLLIFFLFLTISSYLWYRSSLLPLKESRLEEVKIKENMTNSEISALLFEKGLIRSPLAFKIYGFLTKKYKSIKSGTYIISSELSLPEIFEILVKGKVAVYKVTIPEGLTIEETDDYLARNYSRYGFKKGDFKEAVDNYYSELPEEITKEFPQILNSVLEGIFLGDTYFLEKESPQKALVEKMVNNFKEKILPVIKDKPRPEELRNSYEVLILASIVEKEAKTERDRKLVSGVFLKRLSQDDFLQSCATVNYLLKEKKKRLTEEDLNISSPYNTYKVKGLPKAPICSPSLESVKAVLNYKDSDYYYFLSDEEGRLYFSKTFDEHLETQKRIWGGI